MEQGSGSGATAALLPHPLLRDLYSDIEILLINCKKSGQTQTKILTDDDSNLVNFCKTLEAVFRHGLNDGAARSPVKWDYFDVILALAQDTSTHASTLARRLTYGNVGSGYQLSRMMCHIVEEIPVKVPCPATSTGRGRYLLRHCLNNLPQLMNLIFSLQTWNKIDQYYRSDALIRQSDSLDPSSKELFSLIGLVDSLNVKCSFQLELANKSFLDKTWELPEMYRYELVPCLDLGLMICPIRGYIVVTKVKPQSVAGEDGKVEVGDLLEELNGISLFGSTPDHIAKIIRRSRNRMPIKLAVIKARSSKSNFIFRPLTPILIEAKLDIKKLEEVKPNARIRFKEDISEAKEIHDLDDEDDEDNKSPLNSRDHFLANSGYQLAYIGSLQVGKISENNMFLDQAISRVLNDNLKVYHEVSLHILEFGVKLFCRKSAKQVLFYPYPKISACGLSSLNNKYLSFIGAEDDVCSLAKSFLCHVFKTDDVRKAEQIVASMALGFDRTLTAA